MTMLEPSIEAHRRRIVLLTPATIPMLCLAVWTVRLPAAHAGSSFVQWQTLRALTRAIIAMGHSLGLHVVAEGVERRDQLDFLRVEGCDEYQGYYFARPMPEAALAALLTPPAHAALVATE